MEKTIKLTELTEENFMEFGEIITKDNRPADAGDEAFNWWDKLSAFEGIASVSVNILEAKSRVMHLEKMEHHTETPELVVPMNGEGVIFAVAPKGEMAEDQIKAFYLEQGKGIILSTGVRHFIPYPVGQDTDCLIVFKNATGANDLIWEDLSMSYKLEQ